MTDADRVNNLVRECHEYKAQRDAALAEVRRLRAALRKIADLWETGKGGTALYTEALQAPKPPPDT